MIDFFKGIWQQVSTIPFGILSLIEILLLAVILYHVFLWIKNTRTWFLFRGIILILFFFFAAQLLGLKVIVFIAEKTLSILVIALLIIFQPELRAALEQLGQKNYIMDILEGNNVREKVTGQSHKAIDEMVDAAFALSKAKTGALIVIEREIPLEEYAKTGISLDAKITAALLINIFEKNTPLHDGAVIVRGDRLCSATCYLPLSSNPDIQKSLGTRHRAAIGVSEATDSMTIVVSEETGDVSLAVGGSLKHGLSRGELKRELAALEKNSRSTSGRKKEEKAAAEAVSVLPAEEAPASGDRKNTAEEKNNPEAAVGTSVPAYEPSETGSAEKHGKKRKNEKKAGAVKEEPAPEDDLPEEAAQETQSSEAAQEDQDGEGSRKGKSRRKAGK